MSSSRAHAEARAARTAASPRRRPPRAHVGVHARRQRPLVLAELRQHVGGDGDREARIELLHQVRDLALVAAVDVGVDERHGERLDAGVRRGRGSTPATCSRSTGTSVSPRASMRSTASRVSASEAGGSGLTMMIQPASGPGVCERARCRIWPKPRVVISPTRAPLDSSTALVATVVPWTTLPAPRGRCPASAQIRCTPVSTPCDGSAGVDGVFTRQCRSSSSSTRNRSVNVPPTSTPSRYAMPSTTLSARSSRALVAPHAQLLQHRVRVRADRPARGLADPARRAAELRHDPRHASSRRAPRRRARRAARARGSAGRRGCRPPSTPARTRRRPR